jgi:hypothetical protein
MNFLRATATKSINIFSHLPADIADKPKSNTHSTSKLIPMLPPGRPAVWLKTL